MKSLEDSLLPGRVDQAGENFLIYRKLSFYFCRQRVKCLVGKFCEGAQMGYTLYRKFVNEDTKNNYQQGWKMTRTGEYDKMLFWLAEANIISHLCLHELEMCVILATAQ